MIAIRQETRPDPVGLAEKLQEQPVRNLGLLAPAAAPYDESVESVLLYALQKISAQGFVISEDIRTTTIDWAKACNVDQELVKRVFLRKIEPQVLRITSLLGLKVWRIDINPELTWESLEHFPALWAECERLLGL